VTPLSIVGLNDFHGQLAPTTATIDGRAVPVGGAGQLATMFDEEAAALPGRTLLLAAGDNVGATPPTSSLLQDTPTIDVENAWGLDATSYGNHEFDYGIERILQHLERADFPFLSTNIVEEATGEAPPWLDTSAVFRVNGVRVGVIGSTVRTTPELVSAGATEGLEFLDEAERIRQESARLKRQGVKVQVVVIHEGAVAGANRTGAAPPSEWAGPIVGFVEGIQRTTVDLVIAGHTHRAANTVVGRIPLVEGFNAGASYSVAQLMVRDGDVAWAGTATRTAKNLGVASRADVQAIVDAADAETAPLRNRVIGSQSGDILRDPTRLSESAMGNLVADAMLAKYPEAAFAITNSGGLRQDILATPPSGGEMPGEITWGEVFAVLPFNNRAALATITGAQLREGLLNGFSPACNPAIATGRFPQVAGLRLAYHCEGTTPVIDTMALAPEGPAGPLAPIADTDSLRIVTNDFMLTGGDGYTAFAGATDIVQPDELLEVAVEYIGANSPVAPVVQGRITRG
jgi:2',3'-cyclic-nucleotide 2'-phosphodiesterase (5'-nucleotidase family)